MNTLERWAAEGKVTLVGTSRLLHETARDARPWALQARSMPNVGAVHPRPQPDVAEGGAYLAGDDGPQFSELASVMFPGISPTSCSAAGERRDPPPRSHRGASRCIPLERQEGSSTTSKNCPEGEIRRDRDEPRKCVEHVGHARLIPTRGGRAVGGRFMDETSRADRRPRSAVVAIANPVRQANLQLSRHLGVADSLRNFEVRHDWSPWTGSINRVWHCEFPTQKRVFQWAKWPTAWPT